MTQALVKRRPAIDATRILGRLYQGSRPPTGMTLARAGFGAVVLAAEEYQPRSELFPHVAVAHCPLDDHSRPLTDAEWHTVIKGAEFVAAYALTGARVVVTCWQGINRSGLVTAVSLMVLTSCSGLEAVHRVRSRRKGALSNASFAQQLSEVV